MPRDEDMSDGLFACAWCTQRVRKPPTHTTGDASLACPMCGRPMYPLPTTALPVAPRTRPDIAVPGVGVLSRA